MIDLINDRIKQLAEELHSAVESLVDGATIHDAVLFLNRAARLQRYGSDEIEAAGHTETLLLANDVHHRIGPQLRMMAATVLDTKPLIRDAASIAEGELDDVIGWGHDALLAAELIDLLPDDVTTDARADLKRALLWVEANPESFLDLTELSADRHIYERAPLDDEWVARTLSIFSETALRLLEERVPDVE